MTILTEAVDRTLVVTIDRPASRNAIDGPTATALHEAFVAFDTDDAFDVAVLTGADGTFCAGADLKAIGSGSGNRVHEDIEQPGPLGCTRLLLSKPVVAAVEGHAVAGGLELALWCDLRVAALDATFGVYCRRWGVPLVDGGTVRLPRLIGHSRALDMILTGRGVSGEEAGEWGLANRVVGTGEARGAALDLAATLSAFPQTCLRSDRRSSYEQWGLPLTEALANEVRHGLVPIRAGETQAGAARFAGGAGRHGSGV
ncbi:MAG: crotonase/enoyl-CoA hydratase family protein [Acidimicrobiales bacterium]